MRNCELQIFLYKESYTGNSENRKSEKSVVRISDIPVRVKTCRKHQQMKFEKERQDHE